MDSPLESPSRIHPSAIDSLHQGNNKAGDERRQNHREFEHRSTFGPTNHIWLCYSDPGRSVDPNIWWIVVHVAPMFERISLRRRVWKTCQWMEPPLSEAYECRQSQCRSKGEVYTRGKHETPLMSSRWTTRTLTKCPLLVLVVDRSSIFSPCTNKQSSKRYSCVVTVLPTIVCGTKHWSWANCSGTLRQPPPNSFLLLGCLLQKSMDRKIKRKK